jgi:polar amino acid transport system substrate-binding protein
LQKIVFLIFFVLVINPSVFAEDSCKYTNSNPNSVIIGVDDYPPWSYMENGTAKGVDVDILTEVARRLNEEQKLDVQLEFILCFWSQCLDDMKTGRIELLPNVYKLTERERYLDFLKPAYQSGSVSSFYKKSDSRNDIENFAQLSGLSIGMQDGVKHFERIENASSVKKFMYKSNSEMMQALLNGDVDTIIGDKNVFDYILASEAEKYSSIKRQRFEVFIDKPGYFAVSKCAKKSKLWQQFSQQISALSNKEFTQKTISKYTN